MPNTAHCLLKMALHRLPVTQIYFILFKKKNRFIPKERYELLQVLALILKKCRNVDGFACNIYVLPAPSILHLPSTTSPTLLTPLKDFYLTSEDGL
jgi:hypothetical protein